MYVEVVTMVIPVYQRVTYDKYRLPMAQADSIQELAAMIGVDQSHLYRVFRTIARKTGRAQKKGQYQITWIDPEED